MLNNKIFVEAELIMQESDKEYDFHEVQDDDCDQYVLSEKI